MMPTRHGQLVAVRQATVTDTALLADLLGQLSQRTLQLRYMRSGRFTHDALWNEAVRMTQKQSSGHTTLVATLRPNGYDQVIGVAELVHDYNKYATAEIALVVRDDMQRQGIGRFLMAHLIRVAQGGDITRLSASMLAENQAMLRLIASLGMPYSATTRYGETEALITLPASQNQGCQARDGYRLVA